MIYGDNGGDAKNHAEHGEKRTEFVAGEILETENDIRNPLFERAGLG
jgi:hypothetical protein